MEPRMFGKYCLLLIVGLFICCSNGDNPVIPDTDEIVIQAYLYANKPVTDIKITTLALFDKPETQKPINNALVSLNKNGLDYDLSLSPGDSGYYSYKGKDLTVLPGDSFQLNVTYNGKTAFAKTIIPNAPQITYISVDILWVPGKIILTDSNKIKVKWQSPDGSNAYFIVDIKPHYDLPWEVYGSTSRLNQYIPFEEKWSFHEFTISFFEKTEKGDFTFIIYQINREYVEFLMNGILIDGKRKEPFSNIENGYGIFTAFNSDSCRIYYKMQK